MLRLRLAVFLLFAPDFVRADPIQFNRDVRPILAENCYLCHGPDKGRRKKGLRLDDRDVAVQKGAIVPGKPDDSALVSRILAEDASERMPPEETHKTLSATEKDTLKRWIAEGAKYEPHWAYIVPKRPAVPQVTNSKLEIRNPIDRFIVSRLEREGVTPSPEADKRTLLRRLSLDLTGLPPTPAELHAFLADTDLNAYEKQVDRLLASPHFGERMAVPWLDLVRFTDTVGYHGDQNQNVFPYRDYVIDRFNRNVPFDDFTREQLAGDLSPRPNTDQLVATAFNRLNMMTREGGAQPGEYLAKYAADRVRTVSITWLGSTMGCAECHDHKFDPFTSRDFYSMEAFFADIKQWGVYQDYDYTPNPDLKGWSNDHPFPPEIELESPYLKKRIETLKERIGDAAVNYSRPDAMRAWADMARRFLQQHADGWLSVQAKPLAGTTMPVASMETDGRVLIAGKPVKNGELRLSIEAEPNPGWIAAIRLELLPDDAHGARLTRDGSTSLIVQLTAALQPANGPEQKLPIFFADADAKVRRYANGFDVLGVTNGWRVPSSQITNVHTAVYLLDKPTRIQAGDKLIVTIKCDNLGSVRLAVSPLANDDARPDTLGSDLRKADKLKGRDCTVAITNPMYSLEHLRGTGNDPAALQRVRVLQREILECRGGNAMCMVTQPQEPRVTRVLPRGNWQDESGPIVSPSVPAFLNAPVADASGSKRLTRLDLANWLMSPENPLTARVFVNRLWKQFFGVGLSAIMEDVGAQGEWPVHPELLDWLAVEFRESGWDIKHMVKLMVTSAAYRQSSRARPELRERDPNNRWVAYQSPRRLEAEFVRDNALMIAGLLNLDMGGPSVHPYQPAGYYSQLQFPDRRYVAENDDRQYRRGVYMHWQRTFLHPMLANFDAPAREECTANRTVANTPQQALTLLNDPTFVEAARVLAQRLLTERKDDRARLDFLYELALCRPPKPAEVETLNRLLAERRTHFRDHEADAQKLLKVGRAPMDRDFDAIELAAWTEVCRTVLNLQETMTRY
jgi:hypothetical protein